MISGGLAERMSRKNYIQKAATQQIEFLKRYPQFDGRGIKIAIIDNDVADKSLPGLQKTSTGLPKIIDFLPRKRITVDTSTIFETKGKKFITGLSGRSIKIPIKWKNPSNKWHLGSVSSKELIVLMNPDNNFIKFEKCVLKNLDKLISKKDKIIDCIVWFDGGKWRACIDHLFSSGFSNPENMKVLTSHDDEHKVACFAEKLNYCVNIFDDGNFFEIFCPLDGHGTTVTEVAAAYFPDSPKGDGLAPGAQILSLSLKDLEESLLKCIELKVDILNLSCFFRLEVYVKIKEIIKKMVEEHGIIITQAAGNDGPFYLLPEDYHLISDEIFCIGSLFTADEKGTFTSAENHNQVQHYSSRGPLPSGARGIDFVAPGDVITDMPKWYPNKNEFCRGTCYATPNVAGSIACLLSALKAEGIQYSPALIKMALANTADLPEGADKLAYGHGIIQILNAFEFIKKSINTLPMKSLGPLFLNDPNQKGILFINNNNDMNNNNTVTKSYYVNIYPEFVKEWILKCTPNGENFVTEYKMVRDNLFHVKIDTSLLEEGSINYAEIHGFNSSNPSTGPLFYLPITVIFPADLNVYEKEIVVKPGPPTHLFFKCPSDSQHCYVRITSLEGKTYNKITLKYQQKQSSVRGQEIIKFNAKIKNKTLSFKLEEGKELFEIFFYHTHLSALKYKLNINCQKSIS